LEGQIKRESEWGSKKGSGFGGASVLNLSARTGECGVRELGETVRRVEN